MTPKYRHGTNLEGYLKGCKAAMGIQMFHIGSRRKISRHVLAVTIVVLRDDNSVGHHLSRAQVSWGQRRYQFIRFAADY